MAKMISDTPIVYKPKTAASGGKKKANEDQISPAEQALAALGKAAGKVGAAKTTTLAAPVYNPVTITPRLPVNTTPAPTLTPSMTGPAPTPAVPVYTAPSTRTPVAGPSGVSAASVQMTPTVVAAPTYANVAQVKMQESTIASTASTPEALTAWREKYPYAATVGDVGDKTPPKSAQMTVGTEAWLNLARRAWRAPGGAAYVRGTPAYAEREAADAWARSGYDPAYQPKSMSPIMAEYLGISEDERRKFYAGYPSYDGKTYTWQLLATPNTAAESTAGSSSSRSSGGYSSRGGYSSGGGSGGGSSYVPDWYLRMLQWRIS